MLIASIVVALGVSVRKYILKRLNKTGIVANVLYIVLLLCITFPLYFWQFNFTLSSLNDETAKKLVNRVLKFKFLSGYEMDTTDWKPYDDKNDLYNIKATVYDKDNNAYNLYLQPTCRFFKGCKIGLEKIILVEPFIEDIPLDKMSEKMFNKRICSDKISRDLLIATNVKPFFKGLFKKYNTIANSHSSYRLDEVGLEDFRQSGLIVKSVAPKGYRLNNSCSATLSIKGDFKIEHKGYDFTNRIINSMFDRVTKEPNGYLIKTRIDYNIYTDSKIGAIKLNSRFVNMQKMKSFQNKIKSKLKHKIQTKSSCSFDMKFPKDLVVLAAGGYRGKRSNFQIDQSGHMATKFDLVVNYPGKNIALFLSAYEPSVWDIKWTKNTKIIAVYVTGYYRQIVLGLPKSTPMINSTYANKKGCGRFYLSKKSIKNLNQISKRFFGKNVKIVYLAKRDGKVLFGKKSDAKNLITSNEYKLSRFIDKSKPLAGQMGLRELVKKGYIRPYTKEDVQKWAKLQKKLYQKNIDPNLPKVINGDIEKSFKPSFVLHGYTILKEITIPNGLYGANAATFFLPKGVAFPKGNLGHSTLYDFNTGKCYGVMCGVR